MVFFLRKVACLHLGLLSRSIVDNIFWKIVCPLSNFPTRVSKWLSLLAEDSLLTISQAEITDGSLLQKDSLFKDSLFKVSKWKSLSAEGSLLTFFPKSGQ